MKFKLKTLLLVLAAAGLLLAGGFAFSTQEAAGTAEEFAAAVQAANNYGLVVRTGSSGAGNLPGAIQTLNPNGQVLGPWLFQGKLGHPGGGLFDVVISADGKRAAVSNFGDCRVTLINFANPAAPYFQGIVMLPIFAEDLAFTPDGKYVLCSDGGFSARISVIDWNSATVATNKLTGARYINGVEVGRFGKTVLGVDYFGAKLHVFILDPATGALSFGKQFELWGSKIPAGVIVPPNFWKGQYINRPVNVSISPDGTTAVVGDAGSGSIAVFRMFAPTGVEWTQIAETYPLSPQYAPTSAYASHIQSFAFTPDGKKVFAFVTHTGPHWPGDFWTEITAFDVLGPGKLSPTPTHILFTPMRGTSQLFGVDTLAVDPSGRFLYATNPTLSGGVRVISIIDAVTNTFIRNLWLDHTDPVANTSMMPVGIAFRKQ